MVMFYQKLFCFGLVWFGLVFLLCFALLQDVLQGFAGKCYSPLAKGDSLKQQYTERKKNIKLANMRLQCYQPSLKGNVPVCYFSFPFSPFLVSQTCPSNCLFTLFSSSEYLLNILQSTCYI